MGKYEESYGKKVAFNYSSKKQTQFSQYFSANKKGSDFLKVAE